MQPSENAQRTGVISLKKRILSVMLCCLMLLSALPFRTSASEVPEKIIGSVSSQPDSLSADELFSQYALQTLYGSGICPLGITAGDMLTGNERILYDALAVLIRQIAAGQRESTAVAVGQDVTDADGVFYPVDYEVTFPDNVLSQDSLSRVINALLADMPYELYWYDKVSGCSLFYFRNSKTILQFDLQFHVADGYQGAGEHTVDTAKTGLPAAAAEHARSIAASFSAASDYDKLMHFKDTICSLTDYDYSALGGDYSAANDPWELICVFDQDPATKVVCEGYAKAFQYLCDLSVFRSDISCRTVSGHMDGRGHMWNIVSIDGKQYLADVTNSEPDSVGFDGSMFLAGAAGSITEGYLLNNSHYTYDWATMSLWGIGEDSFLQLEPEPYSPAADAPAETVTRLFGADRYTTAFLAADALRQTLETDKFSGIIVACGTNFPDALAGTYLAARKNAPILLVKAGNVPQVNDYIQKNLAQGGTVYLLGGSSVVPDSVGQGIPGITVKRLGGANRYDTNLQILLEAGVAGEDIVICTGQNFADSLSVSAVGLPILLVKDGLTAAQKEFLAATSGKKIIIGGTVAVKPAIEKQLASYGQVTRLAGATRYETSILVAKAFFPEAGKAVLAYAQNFPDGLSGGPLAYSLHAPLILTATGKEASAAAYAASSGIRSGFVLGGPGLISEEAANRIFGRK